MYTDAEGMQDYPVPQEMTEADIQQAKAVSRAGISDLMAVPGVSEAMAKAISDFFSARG